MLKKLFFSQGFLFGDSRMKISRFDIFIIISIKVLLITFASCSEENWNENQTETRIEVPESEKVKDLGVLSIDKSEVQGHMLLKVKAFGQRSVRATPRKRPKKNRNGKKCRKLTKLFKVNYRKTKRKPW